MGVARALFDEAKHPRGYGGRFVGKAGGAAEKMASAKRTSARLEKATREPAGLSHFAPALTGAAALAAAPIGMSGGLNADFKLRGLRKLSSDQATELRWSLYHYREVRYDGLSRALHSGSGLKAYEDDVKAMDLAMLHSKLSSDVVVMRGYRNPARLLPPGKWTSRKGGLKGVEWIDPTYASTTTDQKIAEGFAKADAAGQRRRSPTAEPTLMSIRVAKGTGAIQLSGGGREGESELLLQRGLRYRITADHGVVDGVRRLDVEVVPA